MKNMYQVETGADESYHELDQLLVNLIERREPPDMSLAVINKYKKSVKHNVIKNHNDKGTH